MATTIKKIEDMDYYELLNIKPGASLKEIEKAYLFAIATYHRDSIASFNLISEKERDFILKKIEEAFQVLGHPQRRKLYDAKILRRRPEQSLKAPFRKSTEKIEIEDAEGKNKLGHRIRRFFFRNAKKKEKKPARTEKAKEGQAFLPGEDVLYRGEYLKKVRENRGLSLYEVAQECKLSLTQLKALEEENYDAFPKGKSVSYLLKLYAKALGLGLNESQEE